MGVKKDFGQRIQGAMLAAAVGRRARVIQHVGEVFHCLIELAHCQVCGAAFLIDRQKTRRLLLQWQPGNQAQRAAVMLSKAEIMAAYYEDPLGFVHFAYPWGEPGGPLERFRGPDRLTTFR